MMRSKPHEALDPDFEGVDGGGFIEGRADLGERGRHRRHVFAARAKGCAVDAITFALLAAGACFGPLFGVPHGTG
jgi:hypothetical protein